MPEIELKNFSVILRNQLILQNLSLTVEPGEFIAIVGPSGAGKSTLLRQLNRLSSGAVGQIYWKGRELHSYDVYELRRSIAYVAQHAVMFDGSVRDNILISCRYGKPIAEDEKQERFEKAIRVANVPETILDQEATTLSGGQASRVGMARMLMLEPSVLLLDEPTASLDVESSNYFTKTLKKLRENQSFKKTTYLMVTHRLEEARYLADRILMLGQGGVLVEFTETEQFFTCPQTQRAKDFIKSQELS